MQQFTKTKLTIAASVFYICAVVAFFTKNILVFSLLLLGFLIWALVKNTVGWKSAIFLYFMFALGLMNCHWQIKNFDDLSPFVYTKGTISGVVETIPTTNQNNMTKFYLKADSYETDGKILNNLRARTVVSINDETKNLEKIKIGDRIKITGKLRKPFTAKNPAQFDYSNYLKNQKTFSTFYARGASWEILSPPDNLGIKFLQKLNDKRNHIINIHKKYMKSPNLEVLGGIVFGDDAINPPVEIKTSFINSGLLHILAASGMNVSIIFGIWFFIATRLRMNYRLAIFTGAVLVAFYTLMTGMGPSVLRAAIMIEFVLFGKLINRNTDGIALVFFVALLLLLVNPAMINDVGFQLSFVVTFALMFNCPPVLGEIKRKWVEFIAGAVMIPIVAQLWAAPIQMFYFNTFALYSVFANFAITFFIMVISFLGFLGSIIAMLPFYQLADKVCMVFDFILNPFVTALVKISDYFSSLPNSLIYTSHPDVFKIVLYYSILLATGFWIRSKFKSKKLLAAICVLFLAFALSFIKIDEHKLEIVAFDMGNADSFLIKTPENRYIMIDTGHGSTIARFSMANAIVCKYLRDNGIKNLDVLILTHFDSDHSGGAIDVMETAKVKELILSKYGDKSKTTKAIYSYVKDKNQNYSTAKNNNIILEENDLKITTFVADFKEDANDNDTSIVTMLSYKDFDMLFMADAGVRSYNVIKKDLPEDVKFEVLKVGHHGAKRVVNKDMLTTLKPDAAIISTGYNLYGHPTQETLKTLYKNNVRIFRTDIDNALKITTDGNVYKIEKYDNNERKFRLESLNQSR